MLKTEHFENTEIHHYYDSSGIYILKSVEAVEHLDTELVDGVYNIGIYTNKPIGIIINYYHLEIINPKILEPSPHHIGSFRQIHCGSADWEMICEHEIVINYPEIVLLKKLHNCGNNVVRKAIIDFIKRYKYFDIKSMPFDDATWLMANILGAKE